MAIRHLISVCRYTGCESVVCGADDEVGVYRKDQLPEGDEFCRTCVMQVMESPKLYDIYDFSPDCSYLPP